jgi:hypothetical protein
MFTRSGVHEHEAELLFQALGDEHFSRGERKEVAGEIWAQLLTSRFDLEDSYLLQVLFDFGQIVQIHRPGQFDEIKGFPVNNLALSCERDEKILSLLTCGNDESRFLGNQDGRSRLCGLLAGLELDNQIVFHGFSRLSRAAPW